MSTMIEKVAQAILEAAKEDGGNAAFVYDVGGGYATIDGKFDLNIVARAAIAAMREPTGFMVCIGGDVVVDADGDRNIYCRETGALEVWQGMIDAALKEGNKSPEKKDDIGVWSSDPGLNARYRVDSDGIIWDRSTGENVSERLRREDEERGSLGIGR